MTKNNKRKIQLEGSSTFPRKSIQKYCKTFFFSNVYQSQKHEFSKYYYKKYLDVFPLIHTSEYRDFNICFCK